jgi:hypothetical protein
VNAKLGVWMEACDSQNLFLSPTLSLFGIYSDSVTFANAPPEDEPPPDKRDTVCGQPKSSAPAPAPLRGFPSCEVVEWNLASFFGKVVSTPAEMCPMMPQRQVGVRDVVRS